MNSTNAVDSRREQAVALRRAGKSRREIKEILGITSNWTLNEWLAGEPPPEWTRRPRAKDDLRAKARRLREQGLDYNQIAAELGISKSSVSLWVRDMPWPDRLSYEECRKRAAEGVRRYWETETADIGAAERYWLAITGADQAHFYRPTLKRHNPKTIRRNTGVEYHGCLRIDVQQAADLYQRIEGWARAAMTGTEADRTPADLTTP